MQAPPATLKTCKKCLVSKDRGDFYAHKMMGDGLLSFCKECVKERIAAHRDRNIERIRDYDRGRYRTNPHRQQQLKELAMQSNKDQAKRKAHYLTGNAVRDGRLVRPDHCSICSRECKPEAHHDDYSNPLDVRWMCRSCHRRHHRLLSLGKIVVIPKALQPQEP